MNNDLSNLEVSKEFQCSKEELFKAWTEPEQLKQWWKPLGKHLAEVTNNVTEGGDILYKFEDASLTIDGKYEKASDDLLEYTWNWRLTTQPVEDAAYKLTVQFHGNANSSTLSINQQSVGKEESIQPNKHGWEQGLEQLANYVNNKGNSNSEQSPVGQQKPPISGHNETPEQTKVAGG